MAARSWRTQVGVLSECGNNFQKMQRTLAFNSAKLSWRYNRFPKNVRGLMKLEQAI